MADKEEYARRKAQGICTHCGTRPAEEGKVSCVVCREYQREYDHKRPITPERRESQRVYHQTSKGKFWRDKKGSKSRGYSWELSMDQSALFYTQPCHYCGEPPNGKLNGIDRQDSSVGYIIENCVPCCTTCNYAKQQLSPDEFVWHCKKVVQFNKKQPTKDDRYNQLTIGK